MRRIVEAVSNTSELCLPAMTMPLEVPAQYRTALTAAMASEVSLGNASATPEHPGYLTPYETFGGLFVAMHRAEVRPDGIDITEANLRDGCTRSRVLEEWERFKAGDHPAKTVNDFTEMYFVFPERPHAVKESRHHSDLPAHSRAVMKHSVGYARRDAALHGGVQISVSRPVMQPGGRFGAEHKADAELVEVKALPEEAIDPHSEARLFNWDSLPVARGVAVMEREEPTRGWGIRRIRDTLDNFAELADKLDGNIPNANTTWSKDRSHPFVAGRIVRLVAKLEGTDQAVIDYLPMLEKHFQDWWCSGAEGPSRLGLNPGDVYEHMVRMPDGSIAFRFFDKGPSKGRLWRCEMFGADEEVAHQKVAALGRPLTAAEERQLAEDLGAGAASGQDFTAAHCEDHENLHTIRTTKLVSVGLNALMHDNVALMAYAYRQQAEAAQAAGDEQAAAAALAKFEEYERWGLSLSNTIARFCMSEDGFAGDYAFEDGLTEPGSSMGAIFALSAGVVGHDRGVAMLDLIDERFSRPGGLVQTLYEKSKQQWDNEIWGITQLDAVDAAVLYGRFDLAAKWAKTFLKANDYQYAKYKALYEKSHAGAIAGEKGGGGEYPVVEDLLMSHGADMALRDMLPWLEEMAANQAAAQQKAEVADNRRRQADKTPRAVAALALST